MEDLEKIKQYKQAIKDFDDGKISVDECLDYIHYVGQNGDMTYERFIELGRIEE